MSELGKTIVPGNRLTVVIRDDAPMIHCGDSPSYRSVVIELTPDQVAKLGMRCTSIAAGVPDYEAISKCFIEPPAQGDPKP